MKQAQTKDRLDAAKKAHADSTETLRREERELNQAKAAVNDLKAEANMLRARALTACGMRGSDAQLPDALRLLFENLPDSVEEIDAQIFDLRAKADCIAAVDPAKIEEFEKRRRRIAELQVWGWWNCLNDRMCACTQDSFIQEEKITAFISFIAIAIYCYCH